MPEKHAGNVPISYQNPTNILPESSNSILSQTEIITGILIRKGFGRSLSLTSSNPAVPKPDTTYKFRDPRVMIDRQGCAIKYKAPKMKEVKMPEETNNNWRVCLHCNSRGPEVREFDTSGRAFCDPDHFKKFYEKNRSVAEVEAGIENIVAINKYYGAEGPFHKMTREEKERHIHNIQERIRLLKSEEITAIRVLNREAELESAKSAEQLRIFGAATPVEVAKKKRSALEKMILQFKKLELDDATTAKYCADLSPLSEAQILHEIANMRNTGDIQ